MMLRRYLPYVLVPAVCFALVVGVGEYVTWRQQQVEAADAQQAVAASSAALEVSDVMAWQVEGAGDSSYNGVYSEAGDFQSKPYYEIAGGGRYLYWDYEATPDDGWWVLNSTLASLAKWGHPYHGSEGAMLPANTWAVDTGTAPAPTVTEYEELGDVDEAGETVKQRNAPRDMSEARMEWLEVSGSDTLFVLGVAQATGDMYLDSYDPDANSWTAGVSTVPANIRDATAFDTCAYNDKLYVAVVQPPGSDWAIWEYDPVGDAWTEFTTLSLATSHNWSGYVPSTRNWLRLLSGPSDAFYLFVDAAVQRSDGGFFWRTFATHVDKTTGSWSVREDWLRYANDDALEMVFDASSVPGKQETEWAPIGAQRPAWGRVWLYNMPTALQSPHYISRGNSGVVGAHIERPNATDEWYYYYFGDGGGAGRWLVDTTYYSSTVEQTSHDINGVLDAAGLTDKLYVLARDDGSPAALYILDLRPRAENVAVAVDGSDATVSWRFEDPDLPADEQSAYQVVITDEGGATVDDSTKTVSSDEEYESLALDAGSYFAEVTVWDVDDQASPAATKSFVVGGAAPSDDPPTVSITAPADASTVTGDATITAEASDDNAVADVRFYIDGELIETLTEANDGTDYSVTWTIDGYSNGSKTITVVARDNAGQSASDSHTVTLDASGDTTDPTVNITAPSAAATVSGDVTVSAEASDNVAVASVKLYVDGQLQDTLTAPNDGADYEFTWDTESWANGSHTIRVTATDTAGNIDYDEVSVTLARSLALETKYFFSEQVPFAGVDELWRDDIEIERVVVTAILREELPEDEAARYQVTAGIHVPGTSVNFDDYQRVEIDRVSTLATPASSYRLALRAQPTLVEAYWEIDETAALRFVDVPSASGPWVFATGDATLYRLSAGEYAEWEDLDLTTPTDAVHFDGQVFCAGEELYVVDLDTGELTWEARLPSATAYTALGAGDNAVLVGVDTATSHLLYRFAFNALTLIAEVDASVNRIAMSGDVAAIALDDGSVWRWAGGSSTTLTELADTGEASANCVFDAGSGVLYVGTGTDGEVWYRTAGGDVSLDATLGAGTIRALTRWNSRLYATGLSDGALWRRDGSSGWSQWYTFDGVSQIDDLLVDDDGRLWIAATHSGGARVYRLEAAESGDIETGPNPPNIACIPVKTRPAQA